MLKTEKGFSLIELLIASLISLATIATIVHLHSTISAHTSRQLQTDLLRNTVQDILFLMATDIRRSGFWAYDASEDLITDNPFQTPDNDLTIQAYTDEQSGSCILYAYDIDKDGKVGIGNCGNQACPENTDSDNVEQLGFRLKGDAIQMRYSGSTFTCNSGRWQALTEDQVIVSHLRIATQSECLNLSVVENDCIPEHHQQLIRNISVSITASLKGSSIPPITTSKTIHIKNDKLILAAITP